MRKSFLIKFWDFCWVVSLRIISAHLNKIKFTSCPPVLAIWTIDQLAHNVWKPFLLDRIPLMSIDSIVVWCNEKFPESLDKKLVVCNVCAVRFCREPTTNIPTSMVGNNSLFYVNMFYLETQSQSLSLQHQYLWLIPCLEYLSKTAPCSIVNCSFPFMESFPIQWNFTIKFYEESQRGLESHS